MKKFIAIISVLFLLTGCASKRNPEVTMEIENYGTIKIELYPMKAPNTVANFVSLVESGFYDNNTFHRLVPGFVLQGGDPTATGTGGCGYTIRGEFKQNGFSQNDLSHSEGVVSMARADDPNSAGSQFFIVLSDNAKPSLDGLYAGFGKVIEGMDIIKKIEETEEVANTKTGMLKEKLTINKTTVDTFGQKYTVKKHLSN